MTETTNSIAELEMLKGSVTYKCTSELNGRFTVTVQVDDDLNFGYGFSLEAAKKDAAANALLKVTTNQENTDNDNITAFYTLKEKRKGLIFQSIRKKNGLFDVTVQVDYVNYYGKGQTQTKANNDCATKVLAAFDSGEHETKSKAVQLNAFNTLKDMYSSLLYRTLSSSTDNCEVHVNVDGIDYYGEGRTIKEANNEAAFAALKSIWSGNHKRQLDETDEYWYDDDDYSSSSISSEYLPCNCCCHSCSCCI